VEISRVLYTNHVFVSTRTMFVVQYTSKTVHYPADLLQWLTGEHRRRSFVLYPGGRKVTWSNVVTG